MCTNREKDISHFVCTCHCQLVPFAQNDVARCVEFLSDVPHTIGQNQFLNLISGDVPQYESVQDCRTAPLLIFRKFEHQNIFFVLLKLPGFFPTSILNFIRDDGIAPLCVTQEGHGLFFIKSYDTVP